MTCKDCLHYEACKGTYTSAKEDGGILYEFDSEMYGDSGCEDFTDCSEWVHLPYKTGDTVWYITGINHTLIKSARIEEIIINETGVRELYVSAEYGCYFQNDITTFYSTRKEAEKALNKLKVEVFAERLKKGLSAYRRKCRNAFDNKSVFVVDKVRQMLDNLLKEIEGVEE